MRTTASSVAGEILRYFQKNGEQINNLKLQKLLYYCQAWHLAIHDEALFRERIEAWIHGPVVPPVYGEYKSFGWMPIDTPRPSLPVSEKAVSHVTKVMAAYGKFSAWQLEQLTHEERPWRDARGTLPPDAPCKNIIAESSMKCFYRPLLNA